MSKGLFLFLFFFLQLALGIQPETVDLFNSQFREIVFDMRDSARGGYGDIAAGYLTILDLITNHKIQGQITVVVEESSRKILERLNRGNTTFESSVKVETIKTLPFDKRFDLYISLANDLASVSSERLLNEKPSVVQNPAGKLNLNKNAVSIVQPVFGNTEAIINRQELTYPYALVRLGGVNYQMKNAGLSPEEAGIYVDYVARQLKDQSIKFVENFLVTESESIRDEFSRTSIQQVLDGTKLKGSKVGLIYGVTHASTKAQFRSFLKGLAENSKDSYCLITPSSVLRTDLGRTKWSERVVLIGKLDEMPAVAKPGTIYILKTKSLPHKVFVGLMAYSMKKGFTPLGAGDGFMSAAINLGRPFVMTRVEWNAKNILNFKNRLLDSLKELHPFQYDAIESALVKVYDQVDLSLAQDLQSVAPLFEAASEKIPLLTESIIQIAADARQIPNRNSPDFRDQVEKIKDQVFKRSLLLRLGPATGPQALSKEQRDQLIASLEREIKKSKSEAKNAEIKKSGILGFVSTVVERVSQFFEKWSSKKTASLPGLAPIKSTYSNDPCVDLFL